MAGSSLSSFDFASADQEQFASLLCISPDDIEEITVLKDGAAAAIWGNNTITSQMCPDLITAVVISIFVVYAWTKYLATLWKVPVSKC